MRRVSASCWGRCSASGLGSWLALKAAAGAGGRAVPEGAQCQCRGVVLAPIFVLWFGLWHHVQDRPGRDARAVHGFLQYLSGACVTSTRRSLPNARLLRAKPASLLRHVYLPSATTWILSSLRVSIGFAVTGAVIGEYLGSTVGIGHAIAEAEGNFESVGVFAGLVVLSAFVLLLDAGINLLERRLLVWRPQQAVAEAA